MDFPTVSPAVLDALADSVRRGALAVLVERGRTLSVGDLAAAVADREGHGSDGHADAESVQTALYHAHLPLLAEAEAVTFDPGTELVAVESESPFDEPWVRRLVADHPEEAYDETLTALASARRQAVLYEVLDGGETRVHDLAAQVAAHERHESVEAVPEPVRSVVDLSLSHTHLPVLTRAGLLDGDPVAGTVSPGDGTWRSDPWVAESPIAEWAVE